MSFVDSMFLNNNRPTHTNDGNIIGRWFGFRVLHLLHPFILIKHLSLCGSEPAAHQQNDPQFSCCTGCDCRIADNELNVLQESNYVLSYPMSSLYYCVELMSNITLWHPFHCCFQTGSKLEQLTLFNRHFNTLDPGIEHQHSICLASTLTF